MEGSLDKNDFMDVFYNTFIEKLIAPVSGEVVSTASGSSSKSAAPAGTANRSKDSSNGPVTASPADASSSKASSKIVPASTIGLIVDLLCFCVQHHAFWAKYHVLR